MRLTDDQRNKYAILRIEVYDKLRDYFEANDNMAPVNGLAMLLGYEDYNEMKDNFTDKDAAICRALVGPHGYTICKMILARSNEERAVR